MGIIERRKQKRGARDRIATPSQTRHSDEVMYRWLQQELSKLHADVLEEPLPPEMEELVRQCEDKLFGQNGKDR